MKRSNQEQNEVYQILTNLQGVLNSNVSNTEKFFEISKILAFRLDLSQDEVFKRLTSNKESYSITKGRVSNNEILDLAGRENHIDSFFHDD